MKSSQKLGGWAALLEVVLFIVIVVLLAVVLPGTGVQASAIYADPGRLPAVAPALTALGLINAGFGLTLFPFVWALYERLRSHSPIWVTLGAGLGFASATLFLALGIAGFTAIQAFTAAADQATTGAAFQALDTLFEGLGRSAIFAIGWATLVAGWVGFQSGRLPRWVSVLGLLAGVQAILTPFIPILSLPLFPLLWSAGVAFTLLREPAEMAAPTMALA